MSEEKTVLLIEQLALLRRATDMLKYSFEECSALRNKSSYNLDELGKFEALTSRFARLSDILIQKVFRLINIMELEEPGTVRDRINSAEKKGLIGDAQTFVDVRYLRNDIAHEYSPEALNTIFQKVLDLTSPLLLAVELTLNYCKKLTKT